MKYYMYITVILLGMVCFPNCSKNPDAKIKAPGIVDGEIVTLKSQVAGLIEEFNGKEGGTVERGQAVAKINGDKLENQLREQAIILEEISVNKDKLNRKARYVRANLAHIDKQVNRFRRLKKSGAMPGEKLESMELRKQEAETSLYDIKKSLHALDLRKEKVETRRQYLRLLLEDHVIRSPLDNGVVLETFVSKGEVVVPGASIVDILNVSGLYIETFLEEQEIGKIKLNSKARIIVDGMENQNLSGTVSYFGRKAEFSPKYIISEKERKTLLYQVKIKITGNKDIYKLGMPVTVVFAE